MNPRERRFVLTLSAAHATSHVFRRLVPPLLPVWAVVFGYPLWKLGLLAGVFSLGSGLGQTPMGVLSDRYDRRYILPAGVALAASGYVAFALLPFLSLDALTVTVAGRTETVEFLAMLSVLFVGGVGTAALHPTGYPLLSENVSPERKGRALGWWGSASKFGDALAPAMIGVLLLTVAWRSALLVIALGGIAVAVGLYVLLGSYETRPPKVVASEAGDDADGADEGANDEGGLDLFTGDRRRYVYPIAAIFVFFAVRMMASGGVNVFIPEFVTSVYGFSLSVAGFVITPESTASFYYSALLVTAGVAQLGTGELVDRFDHRFVLLAFLGTATVVLALLATTILSPLLLFGALVVLGASMWGLNPARDALISEITPADREGRTFGYLWTGALVVGSVSPVFIGYVGEVAGLQQAFGILAVVTVVSALPIALLLSERVYRRTPPSETDPSSPADD
jgi:MFS family permease